MKDDKVLAVSPDVQWVGVLDPSIVTFDIVMETKYGTTYNSYFLNAEKKTIIETVKESFYNGYLEKINKVTNPEEIEYIVLNHTEPDHSGSLKHLLKIATNATVVGSGQALNYLQDIVGYSFKSLKVKDGDVLSLGNKTLKFIGAPNLHWPDTIYTYLEEDRILFTCDSFGAHYCDAAMFDDFIGGNYDDSFKYYFDVILQPFSKFMIKAIGKIRPLDISVICPGHGPILRTNWKKAIDLTERYAKEYIETTRQKTHNVLVTYVSAYGYTKEMADNIIRGLKMSGDLNIDLIDLENIQLGELESKVLKSNALIIGSPTINQNTLLPVYKLFSVINPIRDKGKLAAAFGSYGWSGEAVKIVEDILRNLKLKIAHDALSAKFHPHNGTADQFIQFGKNIGEKIMENALKYKEEE